MEHPDPRTGPDISISVPPGARGIPTVQIPTLPPELLGQINEVYMLHNLATNPSKILPPGKSLLSLLSSRTRCTDDAGSHKLKKLEDQVSEVVTRAFWDEALRSLSSPTPAMQLTRLRMLYMDLSTAVTPLLPASHPIVYTLSDPLSPTSSPLRSASGHLRALLSVLRERCAPLRDVELDSLISRLDDSLLADLPKVCIDTVRGIFEVADKMKDDLADFVVGTWTEQDAQTWIRREAIERERMTVLAMFPAQTVKDSYHEWLGLDAEGARQPAITRLMKALGSSEPVSPFPPSGNMLPPPLIFTAFDLLQVQNLLQALVITASLRSLVRPADDQGIDWLSRVWVLLAMEVDRGGSEPAETKLLNLEDEVVQVARSPDDPDAEGRLRGAVQRILRPQDPVFMLLQSRLLAGIRGRLMERRATPTPVQMPEHMHSGRGRLPHVERYEPDQERELLLKGFEDPVLKDNVKRLVGSLRGCLKWTEDTWGEFLGGAPVAT